MNLSPEQFIKQLRDRTERDLNMLQGTRAIDYSNGFTICKKCGSYYHLGKGFSKHMSNGCLHCEGEDKHKVYFNSASDKDSKKLGFKPRHMSVMFDDGMHYCKAKLEIEKFKDEVTPCKCEEYYNCCDCGGNGCGCAYCWSCNACENCLD